jgi:hypothetical protein
VAPLVRQFFARFFDNEIVSPGGDMQTNVTQILAMLATPGLLSSFWALKGFMANPDRYFFVTYSMCVMGFVMVFEWDALFPDRRDFLVLTPMPVAMARLFAAKLAALGIFLGLFALDANIFSIVILPLVAGGADAGNLVRFAASHAAGVLGGGLFVALFFAGLQGVLINVLTARAFRRVSAAVQMIAMGALVAVLLLTPLVSMNLARLLQQDSPLLYWFPPFWFLGLYGSLSPVGAVPKAFPALAGIAVRGLLIAAGVFALTYLAGYRRHARRVLESLETGFRGPGRLARAATGVLNRFAVIRPVERAAFHFVTLTITRSTRHRLFLATYAGMAVALALPTLLASRRTGLLVLPLSLSFFLVSGLRAAFNVPAELRANWVFQITESDERAGHLAATRKWIVFAGILPLFALLAPIEFLHWPPAAALFHLAFGVALSLVLLQFMFHSFRKTPFTCSYFPGKTNLIVLGIVYLFGFTTYSWSMVGIEQALLAHPGRIPLFFAAAAAVVVLLSRRRNGELKRGFVLDYEDAPDPVVRSLNIG